MNKDEDGISLTCYPIPDEFWEKFPRLLRSSKFCDMKPKLVINNARVSPLSSKQEKG